jgi:hypothetical protein
VSGHSEFRSDIDRSSYLKVPQLGELLPTVLKLTKERLDLFMHNLMGADISSLGKPFTTMIA